MGASFSPLQSTLTENRVRVSVRVRVWVRVRLRAMSLISMHSFRREMHHHAS